MADILDTIDYPQLLEKCMDEVNAEIERCKEEISSYGDVGLAKKYLNDISSAILDKVLHEMFRSISSIKKYKLMNDIRNDIWACRDIEEKLVALEEGHYY